MAPGGGREQVKGHLREDSPMEGVGDRSAGKAEENRR